MKQDGKTLETKDLEEIQEEEEPLQPAVNGLKKKGQPKSTPDREITKGSSARLLKYKQSLSLLRPLGRRVTDKKILPLEHVGLLSYITSHWLNPFMWKTFRRGKIDLDNLWEIPEVDNAHNNGSRLERLWKEEVRNKGMKKASLGWVVARFIRTRIIVSCCVYLITLACALVGPTLLVRSLLEYTRSPEYDIRYGLTLALCLFLSEFGRSISFAGMWIHNYRTGIRTRGAILSLLYNKVLRLRSLKDKTVGQLVNLCSNDGMRLYEATAIIPLIIGGPIMAVLGTIYCLYLIGPSALIGTTVFVLFYPYQFFISRLTTYLRRKSIAITDKRVRMMNEILTCIKFIKMYAWEKPFSKKISGIRSDEKKVLEKAAYVQTLSIAFTPMVPIFAAVFTFVGHTLAGNELTATQAFTVYATFHMIRNRLGSVANIVKTLSDSVVAVQRLKSVLEMEELDPASSWKQVENKENAIEIKNGRFAWDEMPVDKETMKKNKKKAEKQKTVIFKGTKKIEEQTDQEEMCDLDNKGHERSPEKLVEVLFDLNLSIPKGKLYGVCGSVGSGKSSLVSAILGQMVTVEGSVAVGGQVAYVSQQAWILNATLRENILFGSTYDEERYEQVLEQCSLKADLAVLPAGDQTEIGERGINLSGGQKQRVSLARALYCDREIYLLDDPLSAVDSHVGKHLFEQCLKGALRDKTVVFITHQLQYLSHCDYVLYMKEGFFHEQGTHADLLAQGGEYAGLINMYISQDNHENDQSGINEQEVGEIQLDKLGSAVTLTSSGFGSIVSIKSNQTETEEEKPKKSDGKLIEQEDMATGSISPAAYKAYVSGAGGCFFVTLTLLFFAIPVGCSAFSNWWLSHWIREGTLVMNTTEGNVTSLTETLTGHPYFSFYVLIYGMSAVCVLVSMCVRGFLFMKTTLRASSILHDRVFYKVLRSPMSFFDTTPVGRILNRFSKDMDEIDIRLPFRAESWLQNLCLLFVSIIVISAVFPWFLIALLPLGIIFFMLMLIFRVGVRELKRVSDVTRSPLLSHIGATAQGLHTIHAYGKRMEFMKKFDDLLDTNSLPFFLHAIAMRWLALRLDTLTVLISSITALLIVALKGSIPTALAGLAITYALQMTGMFQFTIRLTIEVETHFTSVERLHAYIANVEEEAPAIIPDKTPGEEWPQGGAVQFQAYSMRYRDGLPLVLKDINCDINAKEKIGIVGRTGSGKSSLGMALFRMVEAADGAITIDGTPTQSIGLEDLRSRLSVIPQDPVLFVGTIRYNLDPFSSHDDSVLWDALGKCHVKDTIKSLEYQLDAPVVENGENFSVGERQLICMARALLRHSRILILDEATAAIDTETDALIQTTIKEVFQECTVLTIAHRLNTVLNCDRILVLKDGRIHEFDSPSRLLANPDSHFTSMVQTSGVHIKTETS